MAKKLGKKIDNDQIKLLIEQDIPIHEIAEKLGCHPSTIDRRMRKMGINAKRTGPKGGNRHPDWKGGITYRKGYRYLYKPDHPNAINGRYVAEHRLVMENKLGRYLERDEVVHHIDGNPLNNDPENLELFESNAEHLKYELTGRMPMWSEDGKRRIQEGIEKSLQRKGIYRRPKFYVPKGTPPKSHHEE